MKVVITEEPTPQMSQSDMAVLLLVDVMPRSETTGDWIESSLSNLEHDGYVRFVDDKVEITAKGRAFIELVRSIPAPQCFWHCQTRDHRYESVSDELESGKPLRHEDLMNYLRILASEIKSGILCSEWENAQSLTSPGRPRRNQET